VGVSRRALIITSGVFGAAAGVGAWAVLADSRLVPGRNLVDQVMGRCEVAGTPADAEPGRLIDGAFFSNRRGRSVGYVLAYPPKAAPGAKLPVCLVLHGSGADHRTAFGGIGYHRLLAAATAAGVAPFVLAAVAGGDGYWHPHADGDDPLAMLLGDFPTVLAQHGLPVDRFALLGWSMGGFGALIAATEAPDRFVAVVANAPAFWRSYEEAQEINPGAFDSAEDWQRWGDLMARATKLRGLPVRIDCGESDSFTPAVKALRDRLDEPGVVHLAKGCHDEAFWRYAAPEQLRFIGNALTPPKPTPTPKPTKTPAR